LILDRFVSFCGFLLFSFIGVNLLKVKVIVSSEAPKGLDVLIFIPLFFTYIFLVLVCFLASCRLLYLTIIPNKQKEQDE